MRPYTCEQCGHRNYVTREDLDNERSGRGDRAAEALILKLPEQRRPFHSRLADVLKRHFFPNS